MVINMLIDGLKAEISWRITETMKIKERDRRGLMRILQL